MKTENEVLQQQTHLVRCVEAALASKHKLDAEGLAGRSRLLACASAGLADMPRFLIVRLYEAACGMEFPTEDVVQLRRQVSRALGAHFQLRQFRQKAA